MADTPLLTPGFAMIRHATASEFPWLPSVSRAVHWHSILDCYSRMMGKVDGLCGNVISMLVHGANR